MYDALTSAEYDALVDKLSRANRMWHLARWYSITATDAADKAEAKAMSDEMSFALSTLW